MMKHPAVKIVACIVWVVTGLYALNAITMMHGLNLFGFGPLATMSKEVAYLVGICGAISLVLWGMHLACQCEGGSCHC